MKSANGKRFRQRVETLEGRRFLAASGAIFAPEGPLIGNGAADPVSADFDNDGKMDFATANSGGSTVSIVRGLGDGTFSAAQAFQASTAPLALVSGDFNRDGKIDVASSSRFGVVSILIGAGNGTLQPAQNIAVAGSLQSLACADFDRDGFVDLAVAASDEPGNVYILKGDGAGGFTVGNPLNIGPRVMGIAVGDMNRDGKPDLLTATYLETGYVIYYPGNGDGTFAFGTLISATPLTRNVSVADVNGDGKLDVISADAAFAGSITVLHGTGTGTFSPPTTYPVGPTPAEVVAADLDGDGRVDLITPNSQGDGSISILMNTGSSFAPATHLELSSPGYIAATDVNGDARLDIAVGAAPNALLIFLQDSSTTTFSPARATYALGASSTPGFTASADFNNDGKPDLLVGDMIINSSAGSVYVLLGDGAGGMALRSTTPAGLGCDSYVVKDFNLDGNLDVAVSNFGSTNGISYLFGRGDGTFEPARFVPLLATPRMITTGDFNRDGRPDLAVRHDNGSLTGIVSILLSNADKTFITSTMNLPVWLLGITSGDVDGDGIADLITTHAIPTAAGCYLYTLRGNGNGTFAAAVRLATIAGNAFYPFLADLNGDALADLVIPHTNSTGTITIFPKTSTGFGAPRTLTTLNSLGFVSAADVNADGIVDLVGKIFGGILTLQGRTDGTFTLPRVSGGIFAAGNLTLTDLNGDGKTDVTAASTVRQAVTTLWNIGMPGVLPPALVSATLDINTQIVQLRFDAPLLPASVSANDLHIQLLGSATVYAALSASLSADQKTILFTLPTQLPDGNYDIRLPAAAVQGTNGVATSVSQVLESSMSFILRGDATRDRIVDFSDLLVLAQNYGLGQRLFTQGDFNRDGTTDFDDVLMLAQRYGSLLLKSDASLPSHRRRASTEVLS